VKVQKNKQGFTLIELSIVIVIIGLIVAGVTAGNSLVEQAKIRSTISEFDNIRMQINVFRAQYHALPGDFSAASSYWTSSQCPGTCNGNGNKELHFQGESGHVFNHLNLAGISNFNAVGSNYVSASSSDVNSVPRSPLENAYFRVNINYYSYFGKTGLAILLAGLHASDTASRHSGITAMQAVTIDKKVDDGVANEGTIWGVTGYNVNSGGFPSAPCSANFNTSPSAGLAYQNFDGSINCFLAYWLE
jgi:prepilin-type N-terminal cleavage/methylation domain-containing protein